LDGFGVQGFLPALAEALLEHLLRLVLSRGTDRDTDNRFDPVASEGTSQSKQEGGVIHAPKCYAARGTADALDLDWSIR